MRDSFVFWWKGHSDSEKILPVNIIIILFFLHIAEQSVKAIVWNKYCDISARLLWARFLSQLHCYKSRLSSMSSMKLLQNCTDISENLVVYFHLIISKYKPFLNSSKCFIVIPMLLLIDTCMKSNSYIYKCIIIPVIA